MTTHIWISVQSFASTKSNIQHCCSSLENSTMRRKPTRNSVKETKTTQWAVASASVNATCNACSLSSFNHALRHRSGITTSIFINPTPGNVRPPSVMGGGFCFEPVDTPFDFDKGALVHLDNHATFYSLKASQEYLNLIEKYKVYKASYIDSDIGEMAISFYQKYPYLLHVAFDVPLSIRIPSSSLKSCCSTRTSTTYSLFSTSTPLSSSSSSNAS